MVKKEGTQVNDLCYGFGLRSGRTRHIKMPGDWRCCCIYPISTWTYYIAIFTTNKHTSKAQISLSIEQEYCLSDDREKRKETSKK